MLTLDQLLLIKNANLTAGSQLLLRRDVEGVGIGPQTLDVGQALTKATTGENSIVIVLAADPADPPLPTSLSAVENGATITAPTSFVHGGLFHLNGPAPPSQNVFCKLRSTPESLNAEDNKR